MREIVQNVAELRVKSEPVASVEEATGILEELEAILNTMPYGVGLAAVQIGIPKTVGVVKRNDDFYHLINPEVIETEEEIVYIKEGCLSLPNQFLDTKRYRHLTIKNYLIRDGELVPETHYFYYDPADKNSDGLTAIAVQHELDHFNGKLISDHKVEKLEPIRAKEKIGRNDKCPCGSGRKFKKCCLGNGAYD